MYITKQTIFVSKPNSIKKETSKIFDCTRWFFLQKSIFCTMQIFKVCFRRWLEFVNYIFDQLESTFLANFYVYNGKLLLCLVEASFVNYWCTPVRKADFSLTYRNYSSGFVQRGLACIFVSNSLQESIQKTDMTFVLQRSFDDLICLQNRNFQKKTFWSLIVILDRWNIHNSNKRVYQSNVIKNETNDSYAENNHAKWEFLK